MLIAVLVINALMFVVQFTGGVMAQSTALKADAVDMLGGALMYVLSLYVIARRPSW